jgi:methyl-accepting chemotaxis protein
MSNDRSPLSSLFDAQRELISNGQEFVEQTMRVPLEMNDAMRESLARQRDLQREGIERSHDALGEVLDTVESTGPGELTGVRGAVDGGFETLLASHEQVFDNVDESYAEAVEDLAEAIEELTEQVEVLVELNDQLEQRTVETVEGVAGSGLGEFLEQQFGSLDTDLDASDTEGRAAVERQREQIDTVRERIERLQDELQDTVDETADDGSDTTAEDRGDTTADGGGN